MSQPRKIRCTVEAVTDHGGRVYTVDLVPDIPAPAFRSGQFLHLTVDAYDPSSFWPDSRVFSIASSPRERKRIRICYAVKGAYTTKMEQTLRPGGTAWIKLPYGEFVIDDASDAVLIAGGTGISAFTAFIEALTPDHPGKVTLVYGARTPDLWLFRDMIARQAAACPSFSTLFFAENGLNALQPPASSPSTQPSSSPICHPGRISVMAFWGWLSTPANLVYYISGPPTMLRALGSDLTARDVLSAHIRTDAWE